MTAFTPVRIQCAYCTSQGHPCDCESFEAADRGMPSMEDRARLSDEALQKLTKQHRKFVRDPLIERRKSDDAFRGLVDDYFKLIGNRL